MSLAATLISQTPSVGRKYIEAGETETITFVFRNDGTDTWLNSGANAVKLGTTGPDNRSSGFAANGSGGLNSGWGSVTGLPQCRILMQESSVAPGNNGTFTAVFKGNPEPTWTYRESFKLVKEAVAWFGPAVSMDIDMRRIGTTVFNWQLASNGNYFRWGNGTDVPANRTTDIPKIGNGTTVADGYYSALDPDVLYRKAELLDECGFNTILLNWDHHDGMWARNQFAFMDILDAYFPHIRYCFFTDDSGVAPTGIYGYLYEAASSRPGWLKWNGKPLMTIWGNTSHSNSNMSQKRMGSNDPNLDWYWECFPGIAADVKLGDAATIIPRYDDRKVGEMPYGRPSTQYYNRYLETTMYADQFNAAKAYWQSGTINTIRALWINTWDEYHERIGPIEPHEDISVDGPTVDDNSAVNSDTYLFDSTQTKIAELK